MAHFNDYLFPLNEAHVRLNYDGDTFHLDGMPDVPDHFVLPELYQRGIRALYNLLESMVPQISCISISGIWFTRQTVPFEAFDIWLEMPDQGFYLPMATSASLFRENGIPYFHKPLI
jgi:hypothetical protein